MRKGAQGGGAGAPTSACPRALHRTTPTPPACSLAYNLTLFKHGEFLYTGVFSMVREWLCKQMRAIRPSDTASLLTSVRELYARHTTQMGMIRDIMLYSVRVWGGSGRGGATSSGAPCLKAAERARPPPTHPPPHPTPSGPHVCLPPLQAPRVRRGPGGVPAGGD